MDVSLNQSTEINLILNLILTAVVGGGIGGTSACYFLRELFGPNGAQIDLYEPNKIGGRLSVIEVNGRDYEVGGSVIHPRNKYMVEFLRILGNSRFLYSFLIACTFDSECIHFICAILEPHSNKYILSCDLSHCCMQILKSHFSKPVITHGKSMIDMSQKIK
jgi:hypothetical protein